MLAVNFWKAVADVKGNKMCYNTKELYAHTNGEEAWSMGILGCAVWKDRWHRQPASWLYERMEAALCIKLVRWKNIWSCNASVHSRFVLATCNCNALGHFDLLVCRGRREGVALSVKSNPSNWCGVGNGDVADHVYESLPFVRGQTTMDVAKWRLYDPANLSKTCVTF